MIRRALTVVALLALITPVAWFLLWCWVMRSWNYGEIKPGSPWLSAVAPVEDVLRATPQTDRWRKSFMRNNYPPAKYHPFIEEHLRENPEKDPRRSLFVWHSRPPAQD